MTHFRHRAVYGSGISTDSDFFKKLLKGEGPAPFQDLYGKKGVLFSTATLDWFIREEAIHDNYALSHTEKRSIRTFSSGEQKKALLNYLLSTTPDFIILEDVFDVLDIDSRTKLVSRLTELSQEMSIIQVFRRVDEVLPFIDTIIKIEGETIVFSGSVTGFKNQCRDKSPSFNGLIPSSPVAFEAIKNPLIQFRNVSVSYDGKPVLNNICWEINKGDFWQLSGPNGAGKTTLLTMITGGNPKAYGQDLILFGRKKGTGESVWEIKKKIGYVTPAMTTLFNGWHSVESMVVSGLFDSIGLYKKATSFQKKLAREWIDLIGLGPLADVWFKDLSEEQKRMVLIARAMIKHPPLLILDEPSQALSDESVPVLTELVNKIAEESRTAIIYVSHRTEKGLRPKQRFELVPGPEGSEGHSHKYRL